METMGYEYLLVFLIIMIGLMLTVVYYFARYYFRTDEEDHEVAAQEAIDISKVLDKTKHPVLQGPKEVLPQSLESALSNTQATLWGRLKDLVTLGSDMSEKEYETIEEVLYTSDLGPATVEQLMNTVKEHLGRKDRADQMKVRSALRLEMEKIFARTLNGHAEVDNIQALMEGIKSSPSKPQVWMVVGVNGSGKTTSVGKLAYVAKTVGLKTMAIAGDTFRAAAGDQLRGWTERAGVDTFYPEGTKDPSAVVFDGCQSAKAKGYDLVIIDTAGRLHTQANLMEELKKMKRVIQKVIPDAPHEILIVLDANSGQNAFNQARQFNEALGLTGAILTKLDGSAKGGVAVGLAHELGLCIRMIGVGEGVEDLRPFRSKEFVESIM